MKSASSFATSRYLGEGFDDAQLDKLFLTMPISWRGTLPNMQAACTGPCNKKGSIVFGYAANAPLLAKIQESAKRAGACKSAR